MKLKRGFIIGALSGAIGAGVATGTGALFGFNAFIVVGNAAWISVLVLFIFNYLWKKKKKNNLVVEKDEIEKKDLEKVGVEKKEIGGVEVEENKPEKKKIGK